MGGVLVVSLVELGYRFVPMASPAGTEQTPAPEETNGSRGLASVQCCPSLGCLSRRWDIITSNVLHQTRLVRL